jgi:hypothetical protein
MSATTPSQTFQVTVKYVIEKVPSVNDGNLLVLAHPPAPHDPLALELYSRALAILPTAVVVGENPFGEWFESIMDVLGTILPTVGTALSPLIPLAGAVGKGLGGMAESAAARNRNERKQEGNKNMKSTDSVTVSKPSANKEAKKRNRRKGKGKNQELGNMTLKQLLAKTKT